MSSVNKMPILVDLDGVVVDFVDLYYQHAKQYHVDFHSRLPHRDDLTEFYIENNLKTPNPIDSEVVSFISETIVSHPGLFLNAKPYQEAIEGVKYLTRMAKLQGREVHFCSAPHINNPSSWTDKAIWVENNLGKSFAENLILTRDKTLINGCILIDDKPNPIGKYIPTWKHVVFDQSYNRSGKAVEGKWRMMNWTHKEVDAIMGYTKDMA